jgi:hypothetical protein
MRDSKKHVKKTSAAQDYINQGSDGKATPAIALVPANYQRAEKYRSDPAIGGNGRKG